MLLLCNMIFYSYNCSFSNLSQKSKLMKMLTKTILAIIAFVCTTQVISAQTVGKGAWMVGGSAGFDIQSIKDVDDSQTTIFLDPTVGYFIADDLAIGLHLGFRSESVGGNSASTFGLGPFVRYYVTDPIFIQAFVDLDLSENGRDPNFGAEVGYSWFLNNGLAIEPALYFSTGNDITHFGLNIGVQGFCNHEHGME